MKIAGAVALVTGANRGLGQALVAALLDAGAAKVYATAREPSAIASRDPRVVPLTLDVTSAEQIAAAARAAGDVTLLVNNAGSLRSFDLLTASEADLGADLRVHLLGALAVTKAFLPALERAPGGAAIANILSLAALASFPALGGYSASKAAAYSMTQALRPALTQRRIEVLAVLPGPIDTDMIKDLALPKTSPADAARAIVAGIARGDEEIFPDPMAQEMSALWHRSHKDFERRFASF